MMKLRKNNINNKNDENKMTKVNLGEPAKSMSGS